MINSTRTLIHRMPTAHVYHTASQSPAANLRSLATVANLRFGATKNVTGNLHHMQNICTLDTLTCSILMRSRVIFEGSWKLKLRKLITSYDGWSPREGALGLRCTVTTPM